MNLEKEHQITTDDQQQGMIPRSNRWRRCCGNKTWETSRKLKEARKLDSGSWTAEKIGACI